MGKGTYEKTGAKQELNFSLPLVHNDNNESVVVIRVGDCGIEIELKGAYFQRTGGTGNEQSIMQMDAEQLAVPFTGGELDTNFLIANLDL